MSINFFLSLDHTFLLETCAQQIDNIHSRVYQTSLMHFPLQQRGLALIPLANELHTPIDRHVFQSAARNGGFPDDILDIFIQFYGLIKDFKEGHLQPNWNFLSQNAFSALLLAEGIEESKPEIARKAKEQILSYPGKIFSITYIKSLLQYAPLICEQELVNLLEHVPLTELVQAMSLADFNRLPEQTCRQTIQELFDQAPQAQQREAISLIRHLFALRQQWIVNWFERFAPHQVFWCRDYLLLNEREKCSTLYSATLSLMQAHIQSTGGSLFKFKFAAGEINEYMPAFQAIDALGTELIEHILEKG